MPLLPPQSDKRPPMPQASGPSKSIAHSHAQIALKRRKAAGGSRSLKAPEIHPYNQGRL